MASGWGGKPVRQIFQDECPSGKCRYLISSRLTNAPQGSAGLPKLKGRQRLAGKPRPPPRSTESDRKREYSQVVKKKIHGYIFSADVAPMTREDRNAVFNTILGEASIEVFGVACSPVPLTTSCVDIAWNVRNAFRKYADESVDRLFELRPSLRSGMNIKTYRAGRVNELLSLGNHGCFNETLGTVRGSMALQNES